MTTHTLSLNLSRPPMTSNDQRRAHWTTMRRAKALVGKLAELAAHKHNVPPLSGCRVTVVWFAPDARRRDPDSLAPCLKAVLDGLTRAGVFVDDRAPWVVETAMRVEVDRNNPRIEIRIEETENVES